MTSENTKTSITQDVSPAAEASLTAQDVAQELSSTPSLEVSPAAAQEASSLLEFLTFVRRRLRISSTLSQLELMLPLTALAVFSVILVDKFVFWAWLDFIPWVICVSVITFLVLRHVTLSVSLEQSAQTADRQLASQDALSTAHQFTNLPGVFGDDISSRAQRVISRTSPAQVVPLSFDRRPLLATAALGLASICVALLLDPAVRPISIQELERAAINAEKEKILEEASQLRNNQASPDQEELAEELEELAKQLEQSDNLETALTQTERARSEIEASITDSFLAEKLAVQGLNRSLQAMPLTDDANPQPSADTNQNADTASDAANESADAATQFENLSKNLDALSEQEREQLAERLDALADTQQSGNLDLAESLQQASEALQSGDLEQASEALNSSAEAQRAGEDSLADQTARSDAADTLGDAINRFNNLQQPEGQPGGQPGQSGGQPREQPRGEPGQGGQGEGQPGQSGQQPGQGEGQPGGSGRQDGQPGQGGQGRQGQQPGEQPGQQPGQGGGQPVGTGAGSNAEDDTTPSVWLPAESVDILQADGNSSSEPGDTDEIVGLGQVQSSSSGTRIPIDEVISTYRDEAVKSLNRGQVPPTAQDLVRDYFDTIARL